MILFIIIIKSVGLLWLFKIKKNLKKLFDSFKTAI